MKSEAAPATARPVGHVDNATLTSIAQFANAIKSRVTALLNPFPGQKLLDVGCGPGLDTVPLAARVAPHGFVVGIDLDAVMVVSAVERARALDPGLAWHLVSDAAALPFKNDVFDGCRCERVLQHINNGGTV